MSNFIIIFPSRLTRCDDDRNNLTRMFESLYLMNEWTVCGLWFEFARELFYLGMISFSTGILSRIRIASIVLLWFGLSGLLTWLWARINKKLMYIKEMCPYFGKVREEFWYGTNIALKEENWNSFKSPFRRIGCNCTYHIQMIHGFFWLNLNVDR